MPPEEMTRHLQSLAAEAGLPGVVLGKLLAEASGG